MITITPIHAFHDNYIWAIGHADNRALVIVDPGDAAPVIDFIKQTGFELAAIIITHHHPDHVGGIHALKKFSPAPVYGPGKEAIPECDHALYEGDEVYLADIDTTFTVMEVPGHTSGHIAYVGGGNLFCGDTLFASGCGRLFEGTPEQMHHTLMRLAALPENTAVYCAHEYTLANLAFATAVEPNNEAIKQRTAIAQEKRQMNMPTLPSNIKTERLANPFLRASDPNVQQAASEHAQKPLTDPVAVFRELRQWKDNF